MAKVTNKQRAFCEHYIQTWNGTEAARLAKYKGSAGTLAVVACENLRKPNIRQYIKERLQELALTSDEVLIRLSQQATSSISDFIKVDGKTDSFIIDTEKVKEKGHLIKKIKYTKYGLEIELYDSQAALVHLGRHHVLFSDRLQIDDWRSEIVQLLRDGKLVPQDVIDELGRDLATELFVSAGIAVSEDRKVEAES